MLLHGQLSPVARISATAHLALCPACRRKLSELEKATTVLAGAVRGPNMPAWRPHFTFWFGKEHFVISGAIVAIGLMLLSFWINFGFSQAQPSVGSRKNKLPRVMISGTNQGASCEVPKK
jgi:hypothetical protein